MKGMKQFLAAFFLVVAAMQAAAKADGAGLCLRDDATGEWLIGIFDSCAVYENRLWRCEQTSRLGYQLTDGHRRVSVSLRRGKVVVDGRSYRCSELSGPFVPEYPMPDDTPYRAVRSLRPDTATLICLTRSRREFYFYCEVATDSIQKTLMREPLPNADGSVVLRFPTSGVTCFRLLADSIGAHGHWSNAMVYCNPGDTALLYVDDIDGRAFCMGSLSRLNNELMAVGAASLHAWSAPWHEAPLDSALPAFERSYARSLRLVDSVCAARPSLSARARRCMAAYCRYDHAFESIYTMWSALNDDEAGPLRREFIATGKMPAICRETILKFAADYEARQVPPSCALTNFRQIYKFAKFVLDAGLTPAEVCPAQQPLVVRFDSTETAGLQLFEQIVSPYRGKMVYLDFWGAWCGPCRAELKYVKAMREKLRGKDIVYIFLANDTDGESFSELTRRYALEAPGSVSLNLPAGSQAALERFVGVPHFPFSLLLDRRGRPVKGEIPRPSQADELLRLVEDAE